MKNKLIICFAAILTASCVIFSGCGKTTTEPPRTGDNPTKIPTEPTQAHFVITETPAKNVVHPPITFAEGENSLEIENIQITAYERINSEAAKNMNKTLDKAKTRIEDSYIDDCFRLREALDSGEDLAANFPYKSVVDYSYSRNDGKAITIIEKIDSYSAGNLVHSISYAYNFEPLSGELVLQPFCDMESKEDYDRADNQMFVKLNEKYPDAVSYETLNYASLVDASMGFWQFTESGVKVTFPAGIIAPSENGELEIEYAKDELPEFAQTTYFN